MLELAYDLTATEDDRLLQAQGLVRAYCGWHVAPSRTETLVVYPSSRGVLLLPSLYVTSVTSVTESGQTALDASGYRVYEHGEIARVGGFCFYGSRAVTVVFTHGYSEPPAEVTGVVQALAQRTIENPTTLVSRTRGPFTDTFGSAATSLGLTDSEKAALSPYKLPART